MPHFCSCGSDEYICQKCGHTFCSKDFPPQWRPDLTGKPQAGNICPKCIEKCFESGKCPRCGCLVFSDDTKCGHCGLDIEWKQKTMWIPSRIAR